MAIKIDGNGPITGSDSNFQTGDFKHSMRPTVQPGWIVGDGSTIGNVGSGAGRANIDTLDLFTLWWGYTDAQLPILTSAGGASTRGASAAADWAALKRLTVFDVRDRFVRNSGLSNSVNGTKQEGSGIWTDGLGDSTIRQATNATAIDNGEGVYYITRAQTYISGATYTGSAAGQRMVKTRPDNIAMLGCFKL